MYNIKQAAARAGVSVPLLRAWERRYGIVSPERSPSGYRRFDDASVARIREMRRLIADGWSPSAAAAAILDGRVPVPAPGSSVDAGGAGIDDARPAAGSAGTADDLVRAAAALDAARIDAVLDELFSRGSFERVAADLLFPALQRLGEAWAAGEVSVAGEHIASSAVLRRLGQALEAAAAPTAPGKRVVVGLPPGSRHELGALAFAVAARRAGIAVTYVGPDLPVDDWLRAAEGAVAAVLGVVSARDRRAALEVARSLQAADPGLIVAVGGRGAPDVPDVLRLPESLSPAVAALERAIAGRAT
jgi:MerR family transcriptional regulator, light-induced transcriptional regulator